MTLKRLTIGDIETIKELMLDIFSGEPWNDVWTDAQLHRYVSELTGAENSLSFGLYQEGVPVGLALGRVKSWCTGVEYWVDEFGVLPGRQRRGLGSAFLRAIEAELLAQGVSQLVLLTGRTVPAYRFYQTNGFEEQTETVLFVKSIAAAPRQKEEP